MAMQLPEYFTDPRYEPSQEKLFSMGTQMMGGQAPEWLRPTTEYGGQPFEDLMRMTRRDVSTAVMEDAAKRGVHGGAASLAIGKTMGDVGTKMRWADIQRALKGRQWMFGEGRGITEGVRGAGLTYGAQKSEYDYNRAMGIQKREDEKKQREGSFWSKLLSSGIGALGNIAGIAMAPATGGLSMAIPALGSAANILGNRPSSSKLLGQDFSF